MPHEPFLLGSFEVVPLCDGWAPLPLDDEAPGHDVDWDEQRARFPWAFPPDDTASNLDPGSISLRVLFNNVNDLE